MHVTQPVFISPKALLYSPAGTDIPQIEPDEVDGDPDEQNAKSRGSDKTIIQDQSENNKAQQNGPVFIEYKYKHFNTPIVNTNLLIIMNFYAHQFEKLVMHQFIDVEEEERLTGMEYYIFSHQVDEGEASVAGKVMDLPNYTFTLYENKAANDATNEQTTQKENTPEINPEIYILEKLPVKSERRCQAKRSGL